MADKTKIEWTDATWNPIRGCSRVSEGCRNCYAERVAARFSGSGQPYEGVARRRGESAMAGKPAEAGLLEKVGWTGDVKFVEERLRDPLKWREPRKIFVNSMSDLFHEKVTAEQIYKIFMVMWAAHQHTFQVLTKRPQRMKDIVTTWLDVDRKLMRAFAPDALPGGGGIERKPCDGPLANVWFGVSVEDQKTAEERIPLLLQTPAAVRWVSYEPALGPVDFTKIKSGSIEWAKFEGESGIPVRGEDTVYSNALKSICAACDKEDGVKPEILDWVVCGGESGPHARPMHPDWARAARDQCQAAGIPFFFKQWGEWLSVDNWPVDEDGRHYDTEYAPGRLYRGMDAHGMRFVRAGKKSAGRLLDSREWNEFPAVKR